MMITIRDYREDDAPAVGRLIAATFSEFNLAFASPEQLNAFLGPFRHADSAEPAHQEAIARVIRSDIVFVAEDGSVIVGVLRGRKERLASLFVLGDHHRQGIGRQLVRPFEQACLQRGWMVIRLASTVYAVPFYQAMGYKRSTGLRSGWSFEGQGLSIQPMKKVLTPSKECP